MEAPIQSITQAAACRKCGASLELTGRLMIGEVFDCTECRAPLEVASIEPLMLEPFARIEEEPEDFAGFADFELY